MASLLRAPLLGSALRPATSTARVLPPPPAAKGKKGNMMHVEVRAGGRGREGSVGGRIASHTPAPAPLLSLSLPPAPHPYPLALVPSFFPRPQVQVGDDEAPEMAVKRFRRVAGNAAVVMEVSERKKREAAAAREEREAALAPSRRGPCGACLHLYACPVRRRVGRPSLHRVWEFSRLPARRTATPTADARPPAAAPHVFPLTLSLSLPPQAKRRRQFECSQDKAKRRLKEVRMRRSK